MENRNTVEPDIELSDSYGKVQFFSLTKRQFDILNKFKEIQKLVILVGNDQELGEKVRKIMNSKNKGG